MPKKLIVYHSHYGCETGCCGHTIRWDDKDEYGMEHIRNFTFDHPDGSDDIEWAKNMVRNRYGEKHVADLDWEHCILQDFDECY